MRSPPSYRIVGSTMNLINIDRTHYLCERNYTFICSPEFLNNHSLFCILNFISLKYRIK